MQRLHGGGGPVPEEIVMADVVQLVQQHVTQAAVGEARLPVGREEDARLADADEGGCGAGGGEEDLGRGDAGLG